MDAETLYRQLGRLIETAPDFSGYGALNHDQLAWIGRAHALIQVSGDVHAIVDFGSASQTVQGPLRQDSIGQMMLALHKALGTAELAAPPNVQGSFIPVGNSFDAFAAVTKVLQTEASDVLIVDPYLDETALTEFGGSVPASVTLRLLSDQSSVKSSLAPAARRWAQQHGESRPLGVRLAPERTLHDRALFIDAKAAWILTQSLKDFAKRSPAEIVRADDTASLKIAAYEAIWQNAGIIV